MLSQAQVSTSLEMTKTLKEYVKQLGSSAFSVSQRLARWVARPCDDVHLIGDGLDSVLCGAGIPRFLQIPLERTVGHARCGGTNNLFRPDIGSRFQAHFS